MMRLNGPLRKANAGDSYLIFRVRTGEFAIPSDRVFEIRTIPPMPDELVEKDGVLSGSVSLHGRAIPVIDLAKQFGLSPTRRGRGRRFVIVLLFDFGDGNRQLVGLLVDAISTVVPVLIERVVKNPAKESHNGWLGRVRINGRFKQLLDPDRLFSCEELEAALNLSAHHACVTFNAS